MNDQASTLRLVTSNDQADRATSPQTSNQMKTRSYTQSIAISGGKGGIGKSNLSVNLAIELGALGKEVALLDADLGLANADLLCGVTPKHHLGHVVAGWKELDEISIYLSSNVRLLPGGSGVSKLANLSVDNGSDLLEKLKDLEESIDYLLIDTAAGVADNVMGMLSAAGDVIIIATPEPTSIVDAYATIKVILQKAESKPIHIVVNNVVGVGDAEQVFEQIDQVVRKFLNHRVKFLGMIPTDPNLPEAVREQTPIVRYAPQSPASRAIRLIAKQLHSQESTELLTPSEKAKSFWNRLNQNHN
ncbi:MAG: P-loop NTPase [Pyrinomonadaceae bacterium]|nr:P-loop NTPase [Pyrinomonadaceae bacterium]